MSSKFSPRTRFIIRLIYERCGWRNGVYDRIYLHEFLRFWGVDELINRFRSVMPSIELSRFLDVYRTRLGECVRWNLNTYVVCSADTASRTYAFADVFATYRSTRST